MAQASNSRLSFDPVEPNSPVPILYNASIQTSQEDYNLRDKAKYNPDT